MLWWWRSQILLLFFCLKWIEQRELKTNPTHEGRWFKWWQDKINKCRLPTLAPFVASSFHTPWGGSPQLWVVMNGHSLKPSAETSRMRRLSRFERVPRGEVRKSSISPRTDVDNVITASTCSRKLTAELDPLQPSVEILNSRRPFTGIGLQGDTKTLQINGQTESNDDLRRDVYSLTNWEYN